jgi:hypothetical protein
MGLSWARHWVAYLWLAGQCGGFNFFFGGDKRESQSHGSSDEAASQQSFGTRWA